jgi:predicted HicB family RNase H-like nuclease
MEHQKDKTFLLRLPKDLHISLKKVALDRDTTLQELIIDILSDFISKTDKDEV